MKRLNRAVAASVAVLSVVFGSAAAGARRNAAQNQQANGEWRVYTADSFGTKYSSLADITADNVKSLKVAWRSPSADRDLQASNPVWVTSVNEDTPLMVNGTLFAVSGLGIVSALDPGTGKTKWTYDPEAYRAGKPSMVGFVQRGALAYWADGTRERLLFGTSDAYLISIDARTGNVDASFGKNGKVDLIDGMPRAVRATNFSARRPLVAGDVVVIGSAISDPLSVMQQMPPGDVQAYDVRTGKRAWVFHTVPRAGEFGFRTWLNESALSNGSANVWAGMAYDPALGYVYMAGSSPDNNAYGGRRPGDNLFSDTLICVEARTGKRVWHFQAVHHDLWDYDFPATPVLGDITVNGRRIHAVLQVTKQGFAFAFDRKTGHPVWPIEERPVPQSSIANERTSPTQPFPTKPPVFDRQGATEGNVIDFTPALHRQALEQLGQIDHGPLFTPPSEKGTLTVPGIFGGANWGGAGFDPETGVLYVPSITMPVIARAGIPLAHGQVSSAPSLSRLLTIDGLPIIKPPYARITAIDMNKGEQSWMAPLGNGPQRHPLLKDLGLGPLGDRLQRASVLVTKTLLFVSVCRLDYEGRPAPAEWTKLAGPDAVREVVYVFDKRSGRVLHTIELDGMSAAAPMTYMYNGRQYLVMQVGSGKASEVVALTTPAKTTN
jgi:quinoprotein glucose dehydrogenase